MARPGELMELATHAGIGDLVTFLPPVPPDDLADLYAAADLVAVPSYSESFGLVALEAQAAGTPVVAAEVGGLRTAVDHGSSGLLVDGHATRQWADALSGLLDNGDIRGRLAAGARDHAEKFSWAATAAGTLAGYSDALARAGGHRILQAAN